MKGYRKWFAGAGLLGALLLTVSCSNGSVVTSADIKSAFEAYNDGFVTAMGGSSSSTSSGATYTSSDGSVTITLTLSSGSSSSGTETIVFKNYSDANTGYTVNGTITATFTGYSSGTGFTNMSMTETGTLSLSGGPVTSLTFNITITDLTTYSGTITANGSVSWDVSQY